MVGAIINKVMEVEAQRLKGLLLISPEIYRDDRGFFLETYRDSFLREMGIPKLIQHNQSRSIYGVLRGLHFQKNSPQGKLIRVSKGSIFDVAVDIRRESETFGEWFGTILDDEKHKQLWIPPNFAHGFLVLSSIADVHYSCSNYYDPNSEKGILWNDPKLNIKWPKLKNKLKPILSRKDNDNFSLSDLNKDDLPN